MVIDVDASKGGFFLQAAGDQPGQLRPQHPRHHAGLREDVPAEPVPSRVPAAVARRGLPAVHGLDAHQRLEDQPLVGPAHARRRDVLGQGRGAGGHDRPGQPPGGRSLVLHAAPGRRRLRAASSPRWSNSGWNRSERCTSSIPTRSGTAVRSRAAGPASRAIKLGFADKPWEAGWRYHGLPLGADLQDLGAGASAAPSGWSACCPRRRPTRTCPNGSSSSRMPTGTPMPWPSPRTSAATCRRRGKALTTAQVEKWTVDQALDHMEQTALPESIGWIQGAEEGGRQVRPEAGGLRRRPAHGGRRRRGEQRDGDEAVPRRQPASADGRNLPPVLRRLDGGRRRPVLLFLVGGLVEQVGQLGHSAVLRRRPLQSPKFMATMRWAKECGQKVQ